MLDNVLCFNVVVVGGGGDFSFNTSSLARKLTSAKATVGQKAENS